MAAPASFHPLPQRTLNDCALAALAMALGEEYHRVRDAAAKSVKGFEIGLTASEMVRVARRLKRPLRRVVMRGKELPDDEVGVLVVGRGRDYHAVLLFHGIIYDPSDGVVWEPETFLDSGRWRLDTLLLP